MQDHKELLALPAAKRVDFFRKAYALELGKMHAAGKCVWPIERMPAILDTVMTGIAARRVPSGPAFDATMKFFNIKTQKALFAFLEVA